MSSERYFSLKNDRVLSVTSNSVKFYLTSKMSKKKRYFPVDLRLICHQTSWIQLVTLSPCKVLLQKKQTNKQKAWGSHWFRSTVNKIFIDFISIFVAYLHLIFNACKHYHDRYWPFKLATSFNSRVSVYLDRKKCGEC